MMTSALLTAVAMVGVNGASYTSPVPRSTPPRLADGAGRELLPDAAACGYMRVTSDELQSLLLRTSCLDLYLQRNLFLDSDLG